MEFNKYNRRYQNANIYFPMIPFKLWMARRYLQVQGMKPIILCFSIWPSKLFLTINIFSKQVFVMISFWKNNFGVFSLSAGWIISEEGF
jgi:hypothetical protein